MKIKYLLLVSVIALAFVLSACTGGAEIAPLENQAQVSALATCLADAGAKMYGAYWCPHCEDQKAMFGSAEDLPYVECTQKEAECEAAGITGYPTWIFADGSRVSGTQSLAVLAATVGCEY